MTDTRWLDEREQRMWRAYLAARRALDVAIERQLADAGLSTADYEVLVPLSEAAGEVLRARDLGQHIGWDRSRLSHQLRRMELRGLLERFDCPTDARGTMVRLTPAGRTALRGTAPGHVDTVRRHFLSQLAPDEVATLTRAFERIGASRCGAAASAPAPVPAPATSPAPSAPPAPGSPPAPPPKINAEGRP